MRPSAAYSAWAPGSPPNPCSPTQLSPPSQETKDRPRWPNAANMAAGPSPTRPGPGRPSPLRGDRLQLLRRQGERGAGALRGRPCRALPPSRPLRVRDLLPSRTPGSPELGRTTTPLAAGNRSGCGCGTTGPSRAPAGVLLLTALALWSSERSAARGAGAAHAAFEGFSANVRRGLLVGLERARSPPTSCRCSLQLRCPRIGADLHPRPDRGVRGVPTATDADGDGIADGSNNCPSVSPPRRRVRTRGARRFGGRRGSDLGLQLPASRVTPPAPDAALSAYRSALRARGPLRADRRGEVR